MASFTQNYSGYTVAITNLNKALKLQKIEESGTDVAVGGTFRLLPLDKSLEFNSPRDAIGKSVMLEPFAYPGMVVVPQGVNKELVVVDSNSAANGSSVFNVIGLDRNTGTVSLESKTYKGCYMYTETEEDVMNLVLKNKPMAEFEDEEGAISTSASFVLNNGVTAYHPISFVTKGQERNFVLQPLWSFKDESYTVYFNIRA